jgi:hypothetical protein
MSTDSTLVFQKYAHILNKLIGNCCLKYGGTRGRFYYYICSSLLDRLFWTLRMVWNCLKNTRISLARSFFQVFNENMGSRRSVPQIRYAKTCKTTVNCSMKCGVLETNLLKFTLLKIGRKRNEVQLDQNSLANEMRTRGNERVSVRQGYGYGCRYGTLNEANLLKTARTCCSLEADFRPFVHDLNTSRPNRQVRSASGRDFSPLRHSPSCSGRPLHTNLVCILHKFPYNCIKT